MILEILLAIFFGVSLGIITGLIPGVHINLISLSILSLSPIFLNYTSPLILAIIIIGMAITHTFLDTIPSIFLGAPDPNQVLTVLPGHRMLLQGKGYEAIILTVIGSLSCLILAISLTPILLTIIPKIYGVLKYYIGYILIVATIFLIYKEKKAKTWALILFLISGIFGLLVLNSNMKNPLFPLLSGLFGTSTLLISLKDKMKIPKQKITFPKLKSLIGIKISIIATLVGTLCSFLPGLGPSQAAIIASSLTKKMEQKFFLILVGGLSTVNMIISFIALYTINKARNGAVIVISKIIETINLDTLIIFLGSALIAASLATLLAIFISKIFSKVITKLNYKFLCLTIISLITILTIILSNLFGLFILIIATLIGILPPLKNVGKNHLMGCLILPITLYFIL